MPLSPSLSPLYPILDSAFLPLAEREAFLRSVARQMLSAGVTLMQYRNKNGSPREMLADAAMLRAAMPKGVCRLIFNDHAELAVLSDFDGVHVGQEDLSPQGVRRIVGPDRIIGLSTHNEEQLRLANETPADYVAIGPVFETGSKLNPDPVVGLEGVRLARKMTGKPLVAIGGISVENCRAVLEAGVNSVAVISSIFQSNSESPEAASIRFLRALRNEIR